MLLLATFNGENYLSEQLDSIQNQLGIEVLIAASDDCSSDNTAQLLNNAQTENSQLIVLPSKKMGSAAANFFRLLRDADFSNVDYVGLSDQDDIWQSDKLSHAVRKIQENNVDAYSSNVTAFWPNGKQRLINKAQPQKLWDYMFESAGPGCTFVLTQKLALEIQAFLIDNQARCQSVALHDWFIYAFARSRGFNWLIDHESHMLYRQHAENVVGANIGIKPKIQRFKKLREGWLFEQALLIADILGYANMPPIKKIKRLSLLDRFWLILNINKLRRRFRDRIALAFLMLLPFNITKKSRR
jgi:rhamnosyltransferase